MKSLFTVIIGLLLLSNISFAQKGANSYKLTGYIVDSSGGKALQGVNILVLSRTENTNIGGGATDVKGMFDITKIPNKNVRIKVSRVGYQTKVIDSVSLESSSQIGQIKLRATAYEMPELVIQSVRPMVEFKADKKVINIDQVPQGTGTLTDALRNSGVVEVDPKSNAITVHGQSVTIQMDGHPYEMPTDMLAQMPAAMAEQVEVVTSPSAKESAEGSSFILNIISRKNKFDSFSGLANVNFGTDKFYRSGLSLNYKQNKLNLFGSFYGSSYESTGSNDYSRYNYKSADFYEQSSTGESKSNSLSGSFRLGMDYDVNANNSITITARYDKRNSKNDNVLGNVISNNMLIEQYDYARNDHSENDNDNLSLYGFYKKKFEKKGEELTLDALYTKISAPSNSNMNLNYSNRNYLDMHKNGTSSDTKNYIVKLNYVKPTGVGKFETGYNFTVRDKGLNYNALDYLNAENVWSDTAKLSNYFTYKERINALYLTYSNELGAFNLTTGVRMGSVK
jgi:hypothetical protein